MCNEKRNFDDLKNDKDDIWKDADGKALYFPSDVHRLAIEVRGMPTESFYIISLMTAWCP